MADITAKYVRFVATAPCVTNFMASNGSQRKLTALPVDVIKRLIDQGARVVELKEVKDGTGEDAKVVGYEEVVLDGSNYNKDNGGLPVPDDVIVTVDIDKEVADRHAAEWEAHMTEIGKEIKAEQDEKQKGSSATQEDEGGTEGGGDPVLDEGDDKPPVITGGGDDVVDSEDNE